MTYDPGAGGQGGQPQYPPPGGYGGQQPAGGWGQPPAGQPGGYGAPGTGPAPDQGGNTFGALFDFSFNRFATPGLIKLVYIVGTVLLILGWLGYIIVGFTTNAILGLIALVVGAVFVLFAMAMLRMSLEFYFAVVRMSEDIHNRR